MKVTLFPPGTKSLNNAIHLDYAIKLLNRIARQYCTDQIDRSIVRKVGICRNCGNSSCLELHHIKPVWTFVLDIILNKNPNADEDIYEIIKLVMSKQIYFGDLNDESNLIGLCSECHTQADRDAYQYWKRYFEENYRIVFGILKLADYCRYLNEDLYPACA